MRTTLTLLATLAFASAALTTDAGSESGAGAPPPPSSSRRKGNEGNVSCLSDPVLARLKLNAAQVETLDAIFADYDRQAQEVMLARVKNSPQLDKMTDEELAAYNRKQAEPLEAVYVERNHKVREALPVELRPKYDEGEKVLKAFMDKYVERCRAGEMSWKVEREAKAELEHQLDALLGKRRRAGLATTLGVIVLVLVLGGGFWLVLRRKTVVAPRA